MSADCAGVKSSAYAPTGRRVREVIEGGALVGASQLLLLV